jgi:hypothetical protein
MISKTLPTFWEAYNRLEATTRERAQKIFAIWGENPFHPSLHFKCVHADDNVWSVRITRSHRALCIWEKDTATWFWIGSHDDYERLI